jgi:hypothetical protein
MRVGIVTQPLEMNYGGIVQNWALQQVLMRLGHEPITIDAYQRYSTPHYLYNYAYSVYRHLLGHDYPPKPKRYYGALRNKLMGQFIEEHINKTKVMWHYKRSVVKKHHLDAIVVGSDQVWRVGYNYKHIEDMYLRFADGLPLKRVAYAASFGLDEWKYNDEQTVSCAALAQKMDAISVREPSGIDLCRNHLGVEAECVLDPTLLLEEDEYNCIIDTDWECNEPYLAVYCLDITPVKEKFFKQLAQDRGLCVRYFSAGWKSKLTIGGWLAMLKNASMVVTDSFHGTVFSVLFNKDFYTLCNPMRGNTRISSFLEQMGLQERMISNTEPAEPSNSDLNWSNVRSILTAKRKESIDFLSRNL